MWIFVALAPSIFFPKLFLKKAKSWKHHVMQAVQVVLLRMSEEGIVPRVDTYNTLMTSALSSGNEEQVPELFDQLVKLSLRPSSLSYTNLITAFGRMRNYNEAVRLVFYILFKPSSIHHFKFKAFCLCHSVLRISMNEEQWSHWCMALMHGSYHSTN